MNGFYSLNSLDDLSLAEAKVIAAGLEKEYSHEIRVVLRAHGEYPTGGEDGSRTVAVRAMKPERVAAALLALLDANPELEVRLTKHD